ncbi:MAG: hypothetical protein ABL964_15620 [Steroidobacteraceae bacterium]
MRGQSCIDAGVLAAALMAMSMTGTLAAAEKPVSTAGCARAAVLTTRGGAVAIPSSFRYDVEYPAIRYSDTAVSNSITRLQERLDRGELKLEYREGRGYLDSLLAALKIDRSSQLLVYSKSSVQRRLISGATPRALYFNDDTYIGWVKGSDQIEVVTMDWEKGPAFYFIDNRRDAPAQVRREFTTCLSCHDSAGLLGGGVPTLTAYSMPVDSDGVLFPNDDPLAVTDATPLERRWAGWYVTGLHGMQTHLGNLLVKSPEEFRNADLQRNGNRRSVAGLFDSKPYLSDKSDIVALMVFEHQAAMHSLFARAAFKSREFLAKDLGTDRVETPFSELSPRTQSLFKRLLEPVVRGLLFADAAAFKDRIQGTAGFEAWFQEQGPRDSAGRSLREFDLSTRLFRYPLSYLVYSEAFDGLPRSVREYVYGRLAEILTGKDVAGGFPLLSAQEREAIVSILKETKPDFARAAVLTLVAPPIAGGG